MEKCPTCGMNCEIVDKTTMHYEPILPRLATDAEIRKIVVESQLYNYAQNSEWGIELIDELLGHVPVRLATEEEIYHKVGEYIYITDWGNRFKDKVEPLGIDRRGLARALLGRVAAPETEGDKK